MIGDRQKSTLQLLEWKFPFYDNDVRLAYERLVERTGGPLGMSVAEVWDQFYNRFDALLNELFPQGDTSKELGFKKPFFVLTINGERKLSDYLSSAFVFKDRLDALPERHFSRFYRMQFYKNEVIRKNKAKKQDLLAFYNMPEADARFEFWNTLTKWRIDEAVALLMEKDPAVVTLSRMSCDDVDRNSPFVERFNDLRFKMCRAVEAGELEPVESLDRIKTWCAANNVLLPRGLQIGWPTEGKLEHRIRELEEENEMLRRRLKEETLDIEELPLRRLKTIYKIMLVMAIKKYQYKIGRNNEAAAKIEGAIMEAEGHGGDLDEEVYGNRGPKRSIILDVLSTAVDSLRNDRMKG